MSEQTLNSLQNEDFPGLYGKIPSLGDFVTRRLPRGFIAPWETWMQEAIANSREQLGDFWLDNYLTSPMWRFALSPGICGEQGWAGILMPSVDRVGRYYPFTLAAKLDPKFNLFLFMEESESWFARLEELALSCLEDDFQMDALEQQLRQLGAPTAEREELSHPDAPVTPLNNAWHAQLQEQSALRGLYPLFMPHLMKKLLFAYSIWWTQGSERISPSLLICQGLPQIRGASALIDGAWTEHGWEEIETGAYSMGFATSETPESL
ncbi:MAG: type VI secretion system-associated protein TagF [Candidatus Thiodiazotropha taylori]|nr:type VI secretion system-associated protein TagF [Candidatus Thiodiazotropha taylori]MCG7961987.1 type VI secretion system-associated protein TagF [Candidatus Thiodiazotropha endolucinida]MCG7894195.1 type VI secretion system-associated protein TagF [Candidatus Thiodiazotropha taylori]MCG7907888.1 type VI secretion system-associated protein TagF [Candidatus Thiodiazotropha taylori]MCG7911265.1 type VI secretion system-associated protein TagF [Candidatus Thiodiazotropha taylori]